MGIHNEKTEETRLGKVKIYQGVRLEVQCLPAVHTSDTSFKMRCSLIFFFFFCDWLQEFRTHGKLLCSRLWFFLQWKEMQIKVNQWKRFMIKCPTNCSSHLFSPNEDMDSTILLAMTCNKVIEVLQPGTLTWALVCPVFIGAPRSTPQSAPNSWSQSPGPLGSSWYHVTQ